MKSLLYPMIHGLIAMAFVMGIMFLDYVVLGGSKERTIAYGLLMGVYQIVFSIYQVQQRLIEEIENERRRRYTDIN